MTATLFPRVPLQRMDLSMLMFELDRETQRLMPHDAEMITSAVTLVSFMHRHETHAPCDGHPATPHIESPVREALRLIRWGVHDAEIIGAALLHDVVDNHSHDLLANYGEKGESASQCLARIYTRRITDIVDCVINPVDDTDEIGHMVWLTGWAPSSWMVGTAALLVKTSALIDDAGSLRHRLSHSCNPKMLDQLRTYLPVAAMISAALEKSRWTNTGELRGVCGPLADVMNVMADLERLTDDLKQLAQEYDVDI